MPKSYKNRSLENKDTYYSLRTCVSIEIEKFRNEKIMQFIEALGPSPVSTIPFWRRIGRMRNNNKRQEIPTLISNDVEITSNEGKATIFAERLSEIFSNNSTNLNNKIIEDKVEALINKIKNKKQSTFKHFSKKELIFEMKKLNSKTSIDSDNLSNRILKHMPDDFLKNVLKLFNACVENSQIPLSWKTSTIKMIHKKGGEKSDPTSYRPISITSCLLRLLEQLILTRLQEFLKANNIIIAEQSGFRTSRQTRDNLFYLVQKTTEGFNRKRKNLCIFFDLEKAFDKMWHDGLVYKLATINVPDYIMLFIQDFLSNRFFKVQINDFTTIRYQIKCGCPQGAVLSPTLFTIFINDISIIKKSNSKSLLFADDVIFMCTYKKLTIKIHESWNTYLKKLESWSRDWRLNFAPNKCTYTIFSKTQIKNDIEKINLEIYNRKIEYEPTPRFLGITFDKIMKFHDHASAIKKTCISRLNILKILSFNGWKLTTTTLMSVYKSLVRSITDYCSFTFNCMSNKSKKILQTLQNSSIRICHRIRYDKKDNKTISTEKIHKIANIEYIDARCETLKKNYIQNAISTNNPIINELINEYKNYAGGRIISHKTPLCNADLHYANDKG